MNPEDSATKKDLEGLQGTWSLLSAMEDGTSLAEDKVKQTTIVIKDDTFHFPHLAKDATSKAGTIKLDATKKPKQMDTVSTEKEVKRRRFDPSSFVLDISACQPDNDCGRSSTSTRVIY
jgi:uncharacterized protein (TIGR03067 family)